MGKIVKGVRRVGEEGTWEKGHIKGKIRGKGIRKIMRKLNMEKL